VSRLIVSAVTTQFQNRGKFVLTNVPVELDQFLVSGSNDILLSRFNKGDYFSKLGLQRIVHKLLFLFYSHQTGRNTTDLGLLYPPYNLVDCVQ